MALPPRRLRLLLASLALFGCGGGAAPPDDATSEDEIRRAVVDYNVLAAQGRGDAACELMTEEQRDVVDAALIPAEMRDELTDCASYWNWTGPRLPPDGRQVMLDTRVASVSVDGEEATATTTNGAVMKLRWDDGAWRLD